MDFNDAEKAIIATAIAKGGVVWNDEDLVPIKRKIKNFYRGARERCCYCRKDFTDEFNMVIDIEHILPKSKYGTLMFVLANLNISCKRCNMEIKKERTDFVTDEAIIMDNYTDSAQYKFIHPNLDVFEEHIDHIMVDLFGKRFRKYKQLTDKGKYTYTFFELEKMEINELNAAQGIDTAGSALSTNISKEIKDELIALISNL